MMINEIGHTMGLKTVAKPVPVVSEQRNLVRVGDRR